MVDFFIQRPVFATVCALLIVVAGAVCIPSLPISLYPNLAPPQVSVTCNYVGANSQVVESAVTIPLEQQINGVEGMHYITSTSANDGTSNINVVFRTGYDLYRTQPYFYTEDRFIILDLGVHTLDIARVFMGEVERLSCETQRRNPKVRAEDTATVLLHHTSGAVSVVDFTYESRKLPDPFPETLVEIEGPRGAIVVEAGLKMRITSDGRSREEDIGAPLLSWTSRPWHVAQESVLATCRHMLERYRAGTPAETSAADNLKTFALAEAAYAAAASGASVRPRVASQD